MHFSLISPTAGQEHHAAHEWMAGAYEQHQWLWRFLPAPAGSPRRFLFRRRDGEGPPRFYVVSEAVPVAPTPHWQVASKPYQPELKVGEWLCFELRANPVVTVHDDTGRAVRHDVVMQAKTRLLRERKLKRWADWTSADRPALAELVRVSGSAWLEARAERIGVDIDQDSLRVEGYEQHRGKGGSLCVSTLDFSGQFRVRDAKALQQALLSGVGHAKAFGCGLLLVRRSPGG